VCRSSTSRAASIRARIPAVQPAQRPAPPQGQRIGQQQCRPLGVVRSHQLASAADRVLEALRVDLVQRYGEPVTGRQGLHRMVAEELTEPNHAPLDHLGPRRRHLLSSQRVGQRVGADHLSGVHGQSCEHDAITSSQNLLIPWSRLRHPHLGPQ
jgi:hypothetical protein